MKRLGKRNQGLKQECPTWQEVELYNKDIYLCNIVKELHTANPSTLRTVIFTKPYKSE